MKRTVWKRLASLALAAATTASLIPGAQAVVDYEGANLSISGAVTGTNGQYNVSYSASLDIAENSKIVALVNTARVNENWLEALRFTCYLEDALLSNALTSSDLGGVSVAIEGNTSYEMVSSNPEKNANGVSVTYKLTDAAVDKLSDPDLGAEDVGKELAKEMTANFTGSLTNSEVYSAVGSASSISTTGYVLVTYDQELAEENDFNVNASFRVAEATCTTTISPAASGGSSSGGSSSGGSSSGDKTETVTNPDGSTTTTVTKPNGTVTTTTTDKNGNKTEVVENPNGSSQTTVNNKDGSSSVTTVTEDGKVETQAKLPASVLEEAAGETVTLPMPEVPVTSDRDKAPVVTVDLPGNTSAKVEIPVDNVTAGTVAVLVKEDGTEEVIKTTLTTENGVMVTLSDGDTVKIVDNSKNFVDVPASHWAADTVAFTTSRELFNGTSSNTFSPAGEMTRAMIVTVLARYDDVDTTGGANWYEQGAQWAVANGVSDGTNLDSVVSREQLVTMLWRLVGSPVLEQELTGYPDTDRVSDWATMAMVWAVNNGIITGNGAGALNPQGTATRAEVATILARFVANEA